MSLLLLLLLAIYINCYMSYRSVKGVGTKSICYMSSSMSSGGMTNLVPNSYFEVEKLLTNSILEVLSNTDGNNDESNKLYSVDMLVPGLNPKLEQKAILQLELLFSLFCIINSIGFNHFKNLYVIYMLHFLLSLK